MPAADAAFDEVLTALAGRAGGIAPLLDAFFDFLYRRTDFFHVMSSGDKMGFPEGVAETLVMRAFKKFEDAAASARAQAGVTPAPEGATSKRSDGAPRASEPCVTGSQAVKPAVAPPGEAAMPAAPNRSSSSSQSPNRRVTSAAEASQTMPHIASARPPTLDDYNGGRTERYTWEQTLHDVTLAVPVPADTRARDVVCVIKKDQLTLKLRGAKESLIEGRFPCDARNGTEVWETVRVDDSTWSVGKLADGSPVINVYLEKSRESWWKSAIDGDAEIDTTKVDSTRCMYDYDGETQGAIRKILFDEDQKRKGLPTSDELQSEDMLRKAWDAEGSPFRGTPFDPSKVDFRRGPNGP